MSGVGGERLSETDPEDQVKGSKFKGSRLKLRRGLHWLQFIGEDTEDLVKLVVALLSLSLCPRLTPEQP